MYYIGLGCHSTALAGLFKIQPGDPPPRERFLLTRNVILVKDITAVPGVNIVTLNHFPLSIGAIVDKAIIVS